MNTIVLRQFFIGVLALGLAHGPLVQASDKHKQDDCKGKESIHCLAELMCVDVGASSVSKGRYVMNMRIHLICELDSLRNGQGRSDAFIKIAEAHTIKKRVGKLGLEHRIFLDKTALADKLGGKTLDRLLVLLAVQKAVEHYHPVAPLTGYGLNVARITKCIIRNQATWKAIKSDKREIRDELGLGTKSKQRSSIEQ